MSTIYSVSVLGTLLVPLVGKLAFALVVWLVGKWAVGKIVGLLEKSKGFTRLEGTVRTFALSFVKIGLYVLLGISIIGILGVETSSIAALLASAGVTVGLALQGALSNLAGGIMLLVFKPFRIGDYVDAAGVSGVVKEVTLFYTVIITVDNKHITVPNGSLMNANVVNYSMEDLRRVDLAFTCAKSESPARIQELMQSAMAKCGKVLQEPAVPFARLSGGTAQAMEFTVRAWCKNEDYWDVFFDLTQGITETLAAAGVQAPAYRVVSESK